MDVVGTNKKKIGLVALIISVVLIVGYAAMTRFDRVSGPPQKPLQALQPSEPKPEADKTAQRSAEPTPKKDEQLDALTERVQSLVKAERALPAPPQASNTNADAQEPLVVNVTGDAGQVSPSSSQSQDNVLQAKTGNSVVPALDSALNKQTEAKVAEADALLTKFGRSASPPINTADSAQHQERMNRIKELRGRLTDLNKAPVVPGQLSK